MPDYPEALYAAAWALARLDLRSLSRRHTLHAYRLGIRRAELDLRASDLYDPDAQEFIARFPYESIRSITLQGEAVTREVLLAGIRDGASVAIMARRLDAALWGRVGTVEVIARTEANRAANWGRFSGWKKSGLVREKEFIATLDDRVAPDHLEAHGEVVPLEQPFTRGAASGYLMPPLRPNCRCTAAPITRFTEDVGRDREQVDEDVEARDAWAEEQFGLGRQAQVAAIKGLGQAEDLAVKDYRKAWRRTVARVVRVLEQNP